MHPTTARALHCLSAAVLVASFVVSCATSYGNAALCLATVVTVATVGIAHRTLSRS